MSCDLAKCYLIAVSRFPRSLSLERKLEVSKYLLDVDDLRNAGQIFLRAFSEPERARINSILSDLLAELSHTALAEAENIFNDISVVQLMTAMARWKYNVDVGEELERFALSFDRIDDPAIRRDLHARVRGRR